MRALKSHARDNLGQLWVPAPSAWSVWLSQLSVGWPEGTGGDGGREPARRSEGRRWPNGTYRVEGGRRRRVRGQGGRAAVIIVYARED
jgi:hypothetical protein